MVVRPAKLEAEDFELGDSKIDAIMAAMSSFDLPMYVPACYVCVCICLCACVRACVHHCTCMCVITKATSTFARILSGSLSNSLNHYE